MSINIRVDKDFRNWLKELDKQILRDQGIKLTDAQLTKIASKKLNTNGDVIIRVVVKKKGRPKIL